MNGNQVLHQSGPGSNDNEGALHTRTRFPESKPHYQMQFSVIHWTLNYWEPSIKDKDLTINMGKILF